MLKIAARNSPSSLLIHQDLRHSLGHTMDGIWSMFALLHLPEPDLVTCFNIWHNSIARDDPLVLGLSESDVLPMREVAGWLGQPMPCVFYYHRSQRVQHLLSTAGYSVVSAEYDTPECYRGGIYDELKLRPYVIGSRAVEGMGQLDSRAIDQSDA